MKILIIIFPNIAFVLHSENLNTNLIEDFQNKLHDNYYTYNYFSEDDLENTNNLSRVNILK
jgi:hypothetical protein